MITILIKLLHTKHGIPIESPKIIGKFVVEVVELSSVDTTLTEDRGNKPIVEVPLNPALNALDAWATDVEVGLDGFVTPDTTTELAFIVLKVTISA